MENKLENIEKYQSTFKTRCLLKSFLSFAAKKYDIRLFEVEENGEVIADTLNRYETELLISDFLGIDHDKAEEEAKLIRVE